MHGNFPRACRGELILPMFPFGGSGDKANSVEPPQIYTSNSQNRKCEDVHFFLNKIKRQIIDSNAFTFYTNREYDMLL